MARRRNKGFSLAPLLMAIVAFPVVGVTLALAPVTEPTCDLEVRFVNNALEWRCDVDRDCDTCGVQGACAENEVAPLPGSGDPTKKTCRCENETDATLDTCYTTIEIGASSTAVTCTNNLDPCNCEPDFYMGSPQPHCEASAVTAIWAQVCNCLRGDEDADNPN